MTFTTFRAASEYARLDSENGYAQHVNIVRRPAGDYGFVVSDWIGDNPVVGYYNGRELYKHWRRDAN